jgi:hypothetical protein
MEKSKMRSENSSVLIDIWENCPDITVCAKKIATPTERQRHYISLINNAALSQLQTCTRQLITDKATMSNKKFVVEYVEKALILPS